MVKTGIISSMGVVKTELSARLSKMGYIVQPLINMVSLEQNLHGIKYSILDDRLHIGIFGQDTVRENVITQLMAVCTIDGAVIYMLRSETAQDFAQMCLDRVIMHERRSPKEFQQLLSSMDINLYISFSERQPIVALESIAAGVPTIISGSSTIFSYSNMLEQLLVCPPQDSPDGILLCIEKLIPYLGAALSDSLRASVKVSTTKQQCQPRNCLKLSLLFYL